MSSSLSERSDLEQAEKANVLSLLCHDTHPNKALECLVWALLCQHWMVYDCQATTCFQ